MHFKFLVVNSSAHCCQPTIFLLYAILQNFFLCSLGISQFGQRKALVSQNNNIVKIIAEKLEFNFTLWRMRGNQKCFLGKNFCPDFWCNIFFTCDEGLCLWEIPTWKQQKKVYFAAVEKKVCVFVCVCVFLCVCVCVCVCVCLGKENKDEREREREMNTQEI